MKIYEWSPDDTDYEFLNVTPDEDSGRFNREVDEAKSAKRLGYSFERITRNRKRDLKRGDFLSVGGLPGHMGLTYHAYKTLKSSMEPYGWFYEIRLPIAEPQGFLARLARYPEQDNRAYIFDCRVPIDCLDEKKSKIHRFSDGRVMLVEKYVFFAERLGGAFLFRIPQMQNAVILATEPFKALIEDKRLRGSDFTLVWES